MIVGSTLVPWTGALVQARMSEAMGTLRALVGSNGGPSRKTTSWPDIVRNRGQDYGDDTPRMSRPTATPEDVGRLEQVEEWVRLWLTKDACARGRLVDDTGWVLTCRALGWTYARIGRARKETWRLTHGKDAGAPRLPGGNSRPSLVAIERKGLSYVATQLNLRGVPVDAETLGGR